MAFLYWGRRDGVKRRGSVGYGDFLGKLLRNCVLRILHHSSCLKADLVGSTCPLVITSNIPDKISILLLGSLVHCGTCCLQQVIEGVNYFRATAKAVECVLLLLELWSRLGFLSK